MEMEKKCPYINRDDVAQMLIEGILEDNSSPQYAEYIRLLVYSVPSADVAPVWHGKWIHPTEYGLNLPEHYCSECGTWEYSDTESKYCPNCGAKMDEGENDA